MTSLTVEGMSCDHCERSVEDALLAVPGVTSATADSDAGRATIEGEAGVDALVRAIEDAGYAAHP